MALVPRKLRPREDITAYELAKIVQLIVALRVAGSVLYLTEEQLAELEPGVARHFWPNHTSAENIA